MRVTILYINTVIFWLSLRFLYKRNTVFRDRDYIVYINTKNYIP